MNTWKHCSVHGPGDENSWGCPECVRELRKAVAERDARIAELEKALEPFAHPGLSEVLSGICMGDDSTVFQWNKATLLVRHFKKARKALGKGE